MQLTMKLGQSMYRRPKFLEILLDIRCEMALEADYDVDLFIGRLHDGHPHIDGNVSPSYTPIADKEDIKKNIVAALKRSRKIEKG